MRTVILLGFLGVTFAAPLIPQPLLSASNSNELLLGLNNARLRMLQQSLQAPANPLVFPLPGVLQSQTQTSGLSWIPWSSLGHFGGLVPNQIPFPGQLKLAQRTQAIQQEPSQLQSLQQNQQDPYQVAPCFFTYGFPQVWGQMVQYYPVCMYGPQDMFPQFLPQQAGQPQAQEQIPSYTEVGCITQQPAPVLPVGQQKMNVDLLRGDVPEMVMISPEKGMFPEMPIENVLPYPPQTDMANPPYAENFVPSSASKSQTANIVAPATDTNTIPLELMEEKINPDMLKEP